MVENVKSGHTQILTDGDFLLSPSLTNIYEGLHGNGLVLLEDTATGDTNRNAKITTPGYVSKISTNVIQIRGGHVVLDGMLTTFGNYPTSATMNITLQQSTIEAGTTNPALGSGESCLLVVFACSDSDNDGIHIEMGSKVSSGFPVTPETFLADPSDSATLSSKQSTVLAVIKCIYNAGGGDLTLDVDTIYDVRTFLRPTPLYLSPMTTGAVANQSSRIDSHTDLDGMHGGGDEVGSLGSSPFGAIWQSYSYGTDGTDGDHVMYFSGKQGGNRRTHRLGPNKLSVLNTAQTFRFDGPNFFNATPASADINLTPTGTFPPSHMVVVNNAQTATHKVIFDPSGLSNGSATVGDVGPSSSAIFCYTGSAWVKLFATSSATSNASGSAGAVQLSDGSSFTNDAQLTFTSASNTLNVGGPIIMDTGSLLKAPTGLQLTKVDDNPGTIAADTLWIDDNDGDRLKHGSTKVLMEGDTTGGTIGGSAAGVVDVTADSIAFIDANDSNATKKESIADLATAMAGTGISAASGAFNLDATQAGITSIGPGGGTLTVAGNLVVSGATTTLSSTTITVDDKTLELGSVDTPTNTTGDDGGIVLKSAADRTILWDKDTLAWTFNQNIFPSADSTYNLGSNTVRFATGYLDTLVSTDLTIDTNLLKTDSTNNRVGINQASPDAPLQVGELGFGYATGSITLGNNDGSTAVNDGVSSTGIPLFHDRKFRACKLLVEVANTTDSTYETAEMVVTHNGKDDLDSTTAFLAVYGVTTSGAAQQGTYGVDTVGSAGSKNIELQVIPAIGSKAVTVRVSWQALTI